MDKIVKFSLRPSDIRPQDDDDFADRLSSRYTVVQLIIFALLVAFTQCTGAPIACWTPAHFKSTHVKFTNNYCWIKNTYYYPWTQPLLPQQQSASAAENDKRHTIPYYQWIPFILIAQAALFYLPSVIWHGLNSKAGVDIDNIMQASKTFSGVETKETDEITLAIITNQIDRFLGRHRRSHKHDVLKRTCSWGRRSSSYILVLYLLTKLLYIGNAVGQLFLLDKVLSAKYSSFGVNIVRQMVDGVDWTEESYVAFPRVTLCEFKVRGQDIVNVHPYTVQCVLPINIYNEKIYVYLWFWMIFVAAFSLFSLCMWLFRSLLPFDRRRFIRNHLSERLIKNHLQKYPLEAKPEVLKKFTDNYLRVDGVLLLRLIAHNINAITVTDITDSLFEKWSDKGKKRTRTSSVNKEPIIAD